VRKCFVGIGLVVILGGAAPLGQTQAFKSAVSHQHAGDGEAYRRSFLAAFRKTSVEQCATTAGINYLGALDFTPTCTCVTDTLIANYTVEQIEELSSDQLKAVAGKCAKTRPPILSRRAQIILVGGIILALAVFLFWWNGSLQILKRRGLR